MNTHAHPQFGMILQFLATLHRAQYRSFGGGPENKRATVARRQAKQFAFGFGEPELLCPAHDFPQFLNVLALLINEQFGIPDDIDEQNMKTSSGTSHSHLIPYLLAGLNPNRG